jgi:predicted O-linked N-acetylglucosamine transferase (SPINDLY family)
VRGFGVRKVPWLVDLDGSDLRRPLRASFDSFRDLDAVSDREAADQIRELEIDILVDLTGHSRGARLDILARRPAPVQASWLGHAGTMGANFVDYVIADPIVAPFTAQSCFIEKSFSFPTAIWSLTRRGR